MRNDIGIEFCSSSFNLEKAYVRSDFGIVYCLSYRNWPSAAKLELFSR